MGSPHHYGENMDEAERLRLLQRFQSELEGRATRRYPRGRIDGDDLGETAFAIAHDTENHVLRFQFTKPMDWLGLDVKSAREMRDRLTEFIEAEES